MERRIKRMMHHSFVLQMEVLERFRVGSRLPNVACVASFSARFRSKEQGTKVKDRAKNGASKKAERGFIVWLSFHLSRGQNRSFFAPKPMATLATQATANDKRHT